MKSPTCIVPVPTSSRTTIKAYDQDGYLVSEIWTRYGGYSSFSSSGTKVFVNYSNCTDVFECASGTAHLHSTIYH